MITIFPFVPRAVCATRIVSGGHKSGSNRGRTRGKRDSGGILNDRMADPGDEKRTRRCCNCDLAAGSGLAPLTDFTGMFVCIKCMFGGVPIRPDVVQAVRPIRLEVAKSILRFTDARQKLDREIDAYV